MSDYWLGVITLPALAVTIFVIWFTAVLIWQELLATPSDYRSCRCGKGWGREISNHRMVLVRLLSRYHWRSCRTTKLYLEWDEAHIAARKQLLPSPPKSEELRRLLDEGYKRRNARMDAWDEKQEKKGEQ